MTTKLIFPTQRLDFQSELKTRVDAYFQERGITRGANAAMYAKAAFWIAAAAGTYALIVSNSFLVADALAPLAYIALYMVAGFCFACIGFNVGHDAIHGSFSKTKWINSTLAWSFDIIGTNAYNWSIAHNFVHHTYTNIPGVDLDLENGGFIRLQPEGPQKPIYRLQHIYAWVLYCVTSLVWVYTKDFQQMGQPDPRTGRPMPRKEIVKLFIGKTAHIGLLVVVPLLVVQLHWAWILAGYVAMHVVGGFTLAIVFQLAHVVDGPIFPPAPRVGNEMSTPWAEHQLRTTANFGGTALTTFICGGLDYQVEHHLFPKVAHIHYPALAPIVEATATKYGIPYFHNGTFWQAVASHGRVLYRLGHEAPARAAETISLAEAA